MGYMVQYIQRYFTAHGPTRSRPTKMPPLEADMRLPGLIPDGCTCTACIGSCTNRSMPHRLCCIEVETSRPAQPWRAWRVAGCCFPFVMCVLFSVSPPLKSAPLLAIVVAA
ncbi:uncharacterized protein K460DRAFT_214572 [Cucurbitaria berberidis CBS 394.84]|uniref:Uncharacterized protein n=1 Tax=Cucurbitaria berberidis CBS 394.84 TaxID=1168544 RepID=A0A9P4L3P1_9PLEO|nr:uncharacterized protein K460DRAFT_214572 [Cucurbitaria berberidis CBS 394.84]KAF1839978.1 hypothetical protein K460DRAFT_214572 [Cucurbitaria berberidis CBS 394.84]